MTNAAKQIRQKVLQMEGGRANEKRSINVPEWDTDLYVRGVVSVLENHQFHKAATRTDQGTGEITVNLPEAMVETIIGKIEDENGERVFTEQDREFLLREVDGDLITRLYAFVRGEERLSPKTWRVTVD